MNDMSIIGTSVTGSSVSNEPVSTDNHQWLKNAVHTICQQSREQALARQQQLTKPLGSLGRLEDLAIDFAGFQGRPKPLIENVQIRVFAGDHGVVAEGVSAFPQAVTAQMIRNFAQGGAAITVLARQIKADFAVLNLGTVTPLEPLPHVKQLQLGAGTHNFCREPAMTAQQFGAALAAGRDSLNKHSNGDHCHLFVGGEMGIGNTTSAAAIYCALLDLDADDVVGRGTGVDDAGLARKKQAVQQGLQLHSAKHSSPEHILRCLGGFEIAALVGAYISCAQRGIPVLVDGFISTAAASLACAINAGVRDWLIFSHCSAEAGHQRVLASLNAQPLLDVGLRLGEGSGAALVVPLIQNALQLHSNMATFAEASVSQG